MYNTNSHADPIIFKRRILFFVFSIFLFSFGNIIFFTVSPILAQLLQTISFLSFLWFGAKLISFQFENSYFKFLFWLLTAWSVFIIFNGLDLSYLAIKRYLYSDFTFWQLLIPFVAFLPKGGVVFKQMFNLFFYLGFAFIFFAVMTSRYYFMNADIAEQEVWAFSSGCGFILLTWKYHSNFRRFIALVAIVTALLIMTVLARRNLMLTNLDFLLFSFLLYLFFYSKGSIFKKISACIIVAILIVSAIFIFEQRKGNDFKLISSRASEDTRDGILAYYFNGLRHHEWVGKGINGTYLCPVFDKATASDQLIDRDLIECGYLQLMLKGGYIEVILFLLITIPAGILGLFFSKNGLSKACGIIIFLWLVDMVPYGLPTISIRYMLVWFSVGVCYSKTFRNLKEDTIVAPA